MKCDWLILDGRHLLWRTTDAFSTLSVEINGKEIGTGGIYGFLLVAMKIFNRYGGRVMVAWEGSGNFRYQIYPDYKHKEPAGPDRMELIDDMNEQERRLKAVLRSMGVRQFSGSGCEADDVIGRLSSEASKAGETVIVYSGDSDLRQLVGVRVTVVAPGHKGADVVYQVQEVVEKHGVPPCLIPDLKALSGDSSDNIPGIAGIGDKTAAKLIQAYGPVENVIAKAQELRASLASDPDSWPVGKRFIEAIATKESEIALYKKLATIRLDGDMVEIIPKKSQKTFLNHVMGYQFRSLVSPVELNSLMRMGDGKLNLR